MNNCYILLCTFLIFTYSYSQPAPVNTVEKIKLGGLDQTVLIRGNDSSKPLLLILHGGPGFSEFMFFRTYNRDLENDFTVVNWDQRGTGLSYNDSIPPSSMNIKQFVSDAHELVLVLKTRFKKEKIFLLGHSWGTIIGIKLISLYPEDFHAYVGVGQFVNGIENEKISLAYTLQQAKKDKNKKAISELQTIEKNYPSKNKEDIERLKIQRGWLLHYGGVFYGKMTYKKLFKNVNKNELALLNNIAASKGEVFSMMNLWEEMIELDFIKTNSTIALPVYFFSGISDYNTPFQLTENYFNLLNAPKKKLVWFYHSGHFAPFEEIHKFHDIMVNTVLKENMF